MIKKIIALLIGCCLFFTIAGYYFVFLFELAEAKAGMKAIIVQHGYQNNLICFHFLRDEQKQLAWENDHEFSWKGQMFDVVLDSAQAGQQIIYCVADHNETALINWFHQISGKNDSGSKGPTNALIRWLHMQYIYTFSPQVLPLIASMAKNQDRRAMRLPEVSVSCLTPPPQLA